MKNQTITPKQAEIKITSLLRGIDNSVIAVEKNRDIIQSNTKEIRNLIPGLAAGQAPAAKTAKVKVAKPVKLAKIVAAKLAKPVSKSIPPSKKPASKASASKPPPVQGRPSLKEAISKLLSDNGGKPMKAADIYNKAVLKYGYWSHQSLYNALEDSKLFSKTDDGYTSAAKAGEPQDETDSFVDTLDKKSPAASAVANVQ